MPNGTRAHRLANALLGLGLQQGDRVALTAYNCVEWLEIYVALARAGWSRCRSTSASRGRRWRTSSATVEARARSSRTTCARSWRPSAVNSRWIRALHPLRRGHAGAGWRGYEALIDAASGQAAGRRGRAQDPFALMYTSAPPAAPRARCATTGQRADRARDRGREFGLTRDDTGLLVMPLCHANSLYFGVTFAMLGATIVVDDRKS